MSKFDTAGSAEIEKRHEQAEKFFIGCLTRRTGTVCLDGASLYDISSDDDAELAARCRHHYGVGLEPHHFKCRSESHSTI
jgi:hypothetical protein